MKRDVKIGMTDRSRTLILIGSWVSVFASCMCVCVCGDTLSAEIQR